MRRAGSRLPYAHRSRQLVVAVRCCASRPFPRGPRVLFLGGDDVSVCALAALHSTLEQFSKNHDSCGFGLHVVCPTLDRDWVRHKHQFPVARFCHEKALPFTAVDHPKSLTRSSFALPSDVEVSVNDSLFVANKQNLFVDRRKGYDLAIVVSFRYFLPPSLLMKMPPTINLHPSVLPKYRGASPIYSTLLGGDAEGGYSIFKIQPHEKMDCGDILAQESFPLLPNEDARHYFPKVTSRGAAGLCRLLFQPVCRTSGGSSNSFESLQDWQRHLEHIWMCAREQPNKNLNLSDDPHHAKLLTKIDARLVFHAETAGTLYNRWRAFAAGHHRLHPHCLLDKSATPIGEQQLERELARLRRANQKTDAELSTEEAMVAEAKAKLAVPFVVSEALHDSAVSAAVHDELLVVDNNWMTTHGSPIPAGSAYFPLNDAAVCGIKCKDGGWFFWTAGVVRNSTIQLVKSIRDGMALKQRRVYTALFR